MRVVYRWRTAKSHESCRSPGNFTRKPREAPGGLRRASTLVMTFSPDEVGLALVELALIFALASLIRRWSRPLRALFIPQRELVPQVILPAVEEKR